MEDLREFMKLSNLKPFFYTATFISAAMTTFKRQKWKEMVLDISIKNK